MKRVGAINLNHFFDMKKTHFPTALKTRLIALFFILFAFFASAFAQNEASKKLQQIKEFRAYCTELLNALPAANTIQVSSAFSPTGKQKLISVINTLKEASRIKDNASNATFLRLQKNVEGMEDWLVNFEPVSTTSAARANDSPQPHNSDFPNQCTKGCDDNLAYAKSNCNLLGKLGAARREVSICMARAVGNWIDCNSRCGL